MVSLTITFRVRIDGVLTAATSVVLANPANTAGITRDDTGEVVVASGTAMTSTGTPGVYQYTIANAVPGVVYRYYPRVVLDGATYQDEDTATAQAEIVLPTYLTVEAARDLLSSLPSMPRLSAMADEGLNKQLAAASLRIDASDVWADQKKSPTQRLQFPRLCQDEVPQDVLVAVVYEADWLLDAKRKRVATAIAAGLTGQSVGSLSESYVQFAVTSSLGQVRLCEMSAALMKQFVLRMGGIT